MRSVTLLGVACLAVLGTARAEVRLVRSASVAKVQVTSTLSGPWSPVGAVDSRTLNPSGDARHDGPPSHAVNGQHAFVAWYSPEDDQIRCAVGTPLNGWGASFPLRAHSRLRVPPTVEALSNGWVVAWVDDPSGRLSAAVVSEDGRVFAGSIGTADAVLRLVIVGETVSIAAANAGQLVLYAFQPLPLPDPIVFRQIGGVELARVPVRSGMSQGLASGWSAEAVQAELFRHSDNSTGTALTWWTSPSTLSYVELAEDGPVLPVRTVSAKGNGAKYPQSLVNEALRDLGR